MDGYEGRLQLTLQVIRDYIAERGYAPNLFEIAVRRGYSHMTAKRHIAALQARGLLERDGIRHRSLRILVDHA